MAAKKPKRGTEGRFGSAERKEMVENDKEWLKRPKNGLAFRRFLWYSFNVNSDIGVAIRFKLNGELAKWRNNHATE